MTESFRSRASWALAGALGLLLALVHRDPTPSGRESAPRPRFEEVAALVRERYYRPVSERELERAALRGLVGALDPNSAFFDPEEARAFREETEGQFAGLGIEITVEKGAVVVIAPIEDTPAFEAGILPGDRIVAIDGEPCAFDSAEEAARALRGPAGTQVRLRVVRDGATRPEEIAITRRAIDVKSVRYAGALEKDPRIGYVRIAQFKPHTAAELRRAVEDLLGRGARALVLDLRSNPGGHLDEAVQAVDLFVERGLIVRVVGRHPEAAAERHAKAEGTLPFFPMAVLVNGASASAAEVVAGALKDLGRAVVVGTRTFGKGSVQSVIPLADGSILKLTVAHYFTASGQKIQRDPEASPKDPWGVVPDIVAEMDPKTLAALWRQRAGAGYYGEPLPRGSPETGEDVQLDAAVRALVPRLP